MTPPTAADRAKATAARNALAASTPRTTRPGSETTDLTIGDRVTFHREHHPNRNWAWYEGRTGVVVALNEQNGPRGWSYVEVGVVFRPLDAEPLTDTQLSKAGADRWFRADELIRA